MMAERLEWEMEAAPILEQLQLRKRKPLPFEQDVLARRPPDDEAVELGMRAFKSVATERPVGMGFGQIPVTAIWQWCDREGLDPDAAQIMTRAILYSDGVYVARRERAKS